ncbi:MAG TPA: ABC transporter ATP-binding protein [Nevskiales bacterium]|nr:ABC transporter ATP-binding protein [Nevskiales bacterium]
MSYAIEASGIGKRYVVSRQRVGTRTLVEELAGLPRRLVRRVFGAGTETEQVDFWALRGVDFTVSQGEAVGIIGRNGAGKSTLLKILSRVTEPTEGRVVLRGRVASLLEVGTGFHPELSGRENIYLNGAILGMRRHEIAARLEQIVDFAGVAGFIDEPIKHYSSGMYTRLAFAVAAFLESEILIVDEVLAVGDHAFQEKCLGTMRDAATSGRTVLFVSHNMAAIAQITTRTLLLDQGRVAFNGPTREATEHYIGVKQRASMTGRVPTDRISCGRRWRRDDHLYIREIGFADGQLDEIPVGGSVRLQVLITAAGGYEGLRLAYTLNSSDGTPLLTGLTSYFSVEAGEQLYELTIDRINLIPGEYDFSLILGTGGWADPKRECDVYIGFGRLRVSPLMPDGGLFGDWHSAWGMSTHYDSRLRRI